MRRYPTAVLGGCLSLLLLLAWCGLLHAAPGHRSSPVEVEEEELSPDELEEEEADAAAPTEGEAGARPATSGSAGPTRTAPASSPRPPPPAATAPPTPRPRERSTPTSPRAADAAVRPAPPGPPPPAEADLEEGVVISATLTPQRVEEAPSIITVITREEIRTQGYTSLGELLRRVVGVDVNDNGHWPDTGLRGINDTTTYGDKLTMLVDGHNMAWRQFNRNYYNGTWVALEDIERIEIIRGPGSAIWGANALAGVVNIVTRPLYDKNRAEVVGGADHRADSGAVFARTTAQFQDLVLSTSFAHYVDEADALLSPLREFSGAEQELRTVTGTAQTGVLWNLRANYGGFKLIFSKSRWDAGAPLSTFSVVGGTESRFVTDRHLLQLTHRARPFSGFELNSEFHLDDYRFAAGTVYENDPRAPEPGDPAQMAAGRYLEPMAAADRRYELKLQASYRPTLNFSAVAGADLEYLDLLRWHFPEVWEAQALAEPTFDNWHAGAFGQLQYSPWSWLGLTGGTRFDYDEIYGPVITPRAGLVVRLPAGFNLKGLLGTAFKAPSFHDLYYFRRNSHYGNPDLEPESARTGEVQLLYRFSDRLDVRLSGFYSRVINLIGYQDRSLDAPLLHAEAFPASQRPDGTKAYKQKANLAYVTTMGLELETWFAPHPRFTFQLNGTYRDPTDDQGQRLNYTARWTAAGSATVRVHDALFVTLRGLALGERPVPAKAFGEPGYPNWTADQDPTRESPATVLGTLVLRAEDVLREGIDFSLKLDNLTNQAWWDAGADVLYPQRRFQAMAWVTAKL